MKFKILGLKDSYGSHRFSNNVILKYLNKYVNYSEDLTFTWWVERIFLKDEYKHLRHELASNDWFGVMHVPLLTPNWAQYGQNNLATWYFSDEWRLALRKCKGIIVFSKHMKIQLNSLYPNLMVFDMKHPAPAVENGFNFDAFTDNPRMVLVGTWLRSFNDFLEVNTAFEKSILLSKYTMNYIERCYTSNGSDLIKKFDNVKIIKNLSNKDYDNLISRSLLYLDMHETSANNSIIECINYKTPFVARPHPAIKEYCGANYPLFVEEFKDIEKITINDVKKAHQYLSDNASLRESLGFEDFIARFESIYTKILA